MSTTITNATDEEVIDKLGRLVDSHNEIKLSIGYKGGEVKSEDGFEDFGYGVRSINTDFKEIDLFLSLF